VLAGFDSRNLSYQSSAQRFTNRRARLQYDLALLVSYGLVRPEVVAKRVAYGLTDDGAELADRFESLYVRSYRKSAQMIVARHPEIQRQARSALLEVELSGETNVIERPLFSTEQLACVHRCSMDDISRPHAKDWRLIPVLTNALDLPAIASTRSGSTP
jgi:hypothetical protein